MDPEPAFDFGSVVDLELRKATQMSRGNSLHFLRLQKATVLFLPRCFGAPFLKDKTDELAVPKVMSYQHTYGGFHKWGYPQILGL